MKLLVIMEVARISIEDRKLFLAITNVWNSQVKYAFQNKEMCYIIQTLQIIVSYIRYSRFWRIWFHQACWDFHWTYWGCLKGLNEWYSMQAFGNHSPGIGVIKWHYMMHLVLP